jgi:hypothetical protein
LEVHYRYHPYFGRKVLVRRVEQRATGQFLKVQGPAGIVVSIGGWMLDPVICAAMTLGPPRVDLAALIELRHVLMGVFKPTNSRSDVGSFGGKTMQPLKLPAGVPGRQMTLLFEDTRLEGLGALERNKILSTLAQILMQAAGLRVEELDDDKR